MNETQKPYLYSVTVTIMITLKPYLASDMSEVKAPRFFYVLDKVRSHVSSE